MDYLCCPVARRRWHGERELVQSSQELLLSRANLLRCGAVLCGSVCSGLRSELCSSQHLLPEGLRSGVRRSRCLCAVLCRSLCGSRSLLRADLCGSRGLLCAGSGLLQQRLRQRLRQQRLLQEALLEVPETALAEVPPAQVALLQEELLWFKLRLELLCSDVRRSRLCGSGLLCADLCGSSFLCADLCGSRLLQIMLTTVGC